MSMFNHAKVDLAGITKERIRMSILRIDSPNLTSFQE